ncbi:UNVERIFIED_ORG: MinD-like ATPase involved in chromosome partitioning or flagellar assembly [Rhodococcus erythropolis]
MTNPGWLDGLMDESESTTDTNTAEAVTEDTDTDELQLFEGSPAADSDPDSANETPANVVPFDHSPARVVSSQRGPVPAYLAELADPDLAAPAVTERPSTPTAVGVGGASVRRPAVVAGGDFGRRPGIGESLLVEQVRPIPASGWRRVLYRASFGTINRGENPADVRERLVDEQISAPIRTDHKVAVVSLKGGTGKTTVTVGIGHAFADARNDRVLAVDANPDAGALADRINRVGTHPDTELIPTVYDLIEDGRGDRYSDIRAYTLESETGLQVLASHDDPARSEAFSEADYRDTMKLVQDHYQVILSDCGTGITHPAMNGVLDLADTIITTTRLDVASVQRAVAVLDWLDAHQYGDLVARSVLVISHFAPGKTPVSEQQVRDYFGTRVRAVVTVPYDRHLAEGDAVVWSLLHKRTRAAFRDLASTVAIDFPRATTAERLGRLAR